MKRHLLALGAVAGTSIAVACSLAFPVPDAKLDDVVQDSGAGDAGNILPTTGSADGAALVCVQTGHDPPLVPAGARVCVDATPVTRDQYASFVAASVPLTGQLAGCESNTSWTPVGTSATGDTPVHGVDWCDAWAFCAWAGKTLCGGFPGAAPPMGEGDAGLTHGLADAVVGDRDASAYPWACEGGDKALTYPYGNDFDGKQCYQQLFGTGPEPVPVRSKGCEGGFDGLFDLVGIDEWIDSCANGRCNVAGGQGCRGSNNLPADLSTGGFYPYLSSVVGFRCCGRAAPTASP